MTGDDLPVDPAEGLPDDDLAAPVGQFPDDPLHGLVLDDTFVAQARFHESAATERIAQAQRIAAEHSVRGEWRAPDLKLVQGRAKRRRLGRALPAVVAIVVVLGVAVWRPGLNHDGSATQVAATTDGPPLVRTRSTTRVQPAPIIPSAGMSYAFESGAPKGDGSPRLSWNPCESIHYVVRSAGSPASSDVLLAASFGAASQAAGLGFVSDGASDEDPDERRAPYQPDRYGKRWAPVLIVWSDEKESPRLAGDVAGYAMAIDRREPGHASHYVSGLIVLDRPTIERLQPAEAGAVIQHEVGHLLGLDHVEDPTQLMNPTSTAGGPVTYANGDRHGLALLGSGGCD